MALAKLKIPSSRIIGVRSRSDDFGVIGQVRMRPGETLGWALEFAGTEATPGAALYDMSAPTVSGDDSGDMTIEDYEEIDTQARFEVTVDSDADAGADIELDFPVQLSSDETILITVPVTIGA